MRIDRLHHPAILLAALAFVAPAAAQPQNLPPYPTPRLTVISPTGGKPGASFEMTLTGADIDSAIDLVFSHPGFKADLIDSQTDSSSTTPMRQRNPQGMFAANATAKFKVTVPPDAPPGVHDVRVLSKWGVTNPRAFVVSNLEDVLEKESNNDVTEAQKVALETAITGNIGSPTDVDYFGFSGRKGQRVVAACAAWGIDSRLTAQVQLFDAGGRELAANRNYRDRDAVLDATLPDDGEYRVRVSEFAHLVGGPEYFYRLTITTAPWIDAAYPPVVPAGKESVVTLFGRNLPGGKPDAKAMLDGRPLDRLDVRITAPAASTGLDVRDVLPPSAASLEAFEYRLRTPSGVSNPVLLGLARAPVVLDNEDNDAPEKAQTIPVPCEVCGRTEKRGDRDRYVFTAKQGDVLLIDGQCERLGHPADLYVQVLRADTRAIVAEIDDPALTDIPASVGRFYTRTDDPRGRVTIPADGRYELVVAARTIDVKADPRSVYRVTLEREAPDFQVVLTGSGDIGAGGCTVQLGGSREIMVACFRTGNFNGEVTLEAEGLPAGVTAAPQTIGPNQRQGWLVLTSAADGRATVGTFRVKATATVNGEKVVREARAGCLVWPLLGPNLQQQPNIPAISRLCRSLAVAVTGPGPFSLKTPDREIAVPVGGTVSVKVEVERQDDFKGPIQLVRLIEAGQPGQGGRQGQMQPVTIPAGQNSGEVRFQLFTNTPPGSFNLVLLGSSQISFSKDPKANKTNVSYVAAVPSVRVLVTSGVVDLAPAARSVAVKPGGQAPLSIKLTRLANFRGEVKLSLVPPQGFQGLSAAPVTVGPGETEGKLMLTAAANARQATNSNVIVRATTTVGGNTMTQDARITVAVSNDAEAVFAGETSAKTLVAASSEGWKFAAAEKVKGDGWKRMDFDDKGWKSGKAPIGFGEEEIANRKGTTITEQGHVLFRRVIDIPAEMLAQKGTSFRLLVASDNSAEVSVNGDLLDDDPEADHEFKYWNREVDLGAKLFKPGKNVIAVRVRNTEGSSDLFFDMELSALVPVAPKK